MKRFLLLLLLLCISFPLGLSACSNGTGARDGTAKHRFNYYYQKVALGMSKEEVGKATGLKASASTDPDEPKGAFSYVDSDGTGVHVIFNEDMRVYSIDMYRIKPATDVAPLMKSPITIEQCGKLKQGMSHSDVIALLGGDGVEIGVIASRQDCTGVIERFCMWANEDGASLDIAFSADDTVSSFHYYD